MSVYSPKASTFIASQHRSKMTSIYIDRGVIDESEMAVERSFCGEGCTFDAVGIDCSLAFRMVEMAIKRMMRGVGDDLEEFVVARVVNPEEAALAGMNTKSCPTEFVPLTSPKSSSTLPSTRPFYLHTSSLPLLAHPDSSLLSTRGRPSGHYYHRRSTLLRAPGLLHHHHHPDSSDETASPYHHKDISVTTNPHLVSLPPSVQSELVEAASNKPEASSEVHGLPSISPLAAHHNNTTSISSACRNLSRISSSLLLEKHRHLVCLFFPFCKVCYDFRSG